MSISEKIAFLISNPSSESGTLDTLPGTRGLKVLNRQELQEQKDLRFGKTDKVCLTTESILDDVLQRLDDEERKSAVLRLKDKFAFRELLKSIYPDFYFKQCKLEELPNEIPNHQAKYVIKPVKGCFGSGVRVIDGNVNMQELIVEIKTELARNSAVLSSDVLTPNEFLIESYIEGEEYAVDMFYDSHGKPIMTNIYHHPMPQNPAYLHMLYYSSRETFEKIYKPAKEFFIKLNQALQVTNLPIHSEFRWRNGQLIPIELNSFRFGGMGLSNLGYHALGVNAYRCYIEDREPAWKSVWKDKDNIFGFFIAYNGANVDVTKTRPDWERLRKQFSHMILEVPFDYQKQLAFGILYIEERQEHIPKLLEIEFDDYFVPLENA
jgi:hypothetical protein